MDLVRLVGGDVDAVVPDKRIGKGDHLPVVRRIGDHFLVAGHAGIEDYLAEDGARRAESVAMEDRAVFEQRRQQA